MAATDGPAGGAAVERSSQPSWRRRSTPAQLLAAGMIGVANAIYGPKDDEIAIVAEAPGGPPGDDEPVEVHLDPDDPAASTAIVRHPRPPDAL